LELHQPFQQGLADSFGFDQISPRNTYRKTPQQDRENGVEWEAHRATIF
jgi:hypothetical protein